MSMFKHILAATLLAAPGAALAAPPSMHRVDTPASGIEAMQVGTTDLTFIGEVKPDQGGKAEVKPPGKSLTA